MLREVRLGKSGVEQIPESRTGERDHVVFPIVDDGEMLISCLCSARMICPSKDKLAVYSATSNIQLVPATLSPRSRRQLSSTMARHNETESVDSHALRNSRTRRLTVECSRIGQPAATGVFAEHAEGLASRFKRRLGSQALTSSTMMLDGGRLQEYSLQESHGHNNSLGRLHHVFFCCRRRPAGFDAKA